MSLIRVKEVVTYGGHRVSANGAVGLTLNGRYDELVHTIQAIQLLNNDVFIKAKIPGNKPMRIGMFRIKGIDIGGDGASKLKFEGLSDYVEMDNLNVLPTTKDNDTPLFTIMLEADVEIEEGETGGEGEEQD